jgi:putative NADPH-quinone reductase
MSRHIAIIDAHPDPDPARYIHVLAAAYVDGAREAGYEVRDIRLADHSIPPLVSRDSWTHDRVPIGVKPGQDAIGWADHIVFLYPLWLGDMPALLKAFLEQALRPGFAVKEDLDQAGPKLLAGKSARLVITMGMPAFFYRAYYGSHSVRSFKRNILGLVGIDPVTSSLIGNVEGDLRTREKWLDRMREYGRAGS